MKRIYIIMIILVLHVVLFLFQGGQSAAEQHKEKLELTDLSIEELMAIEVTSVSKKEEKMIDTPAAIYVITYEDIRRSGHTSIPELLRMVPGLHVARVDGNKWAITSRGFNSGIYNDKLLVLIDGRTVYSPLYGGVYWDVQDLMLDDIERIEVIRGPGGTLWGANAVNGVINIITKRAEDTGGVIVSVGGGTEEKVFSGVRYGGHLNDNTHYRIYSKFFNRGKSINVTDHDTGADDYEAVRGGFRIDWDRSRKDNITLQGDIYKGNAGRELTEGSLTPPYTISSDDNIHNRGGNILGRWKHDLSNASDISMRFFYDRTERDHASLDEVRDTFDLDFQHHLKIKDNHDIVWGLGYRYTKDRTTGSFSIAFDPAKRSDQIVSAFLQDDITLVEEKLHFIVGSKFEHNDYTGNEIQPGVRLLWTPNTHETVWFAVSRAVQTPTRAHSDMRINYLVLPGKTMPTVFAVDGNNDLKSQELLAYELGYRLQPNKSLFIDMTGFYNEYNNLYTIETGSVGTETTPSPLHLLIPQTYDNKLYGETYGAEISSHWQVKEDWKLIAGYSYLQIQLRQDNSSTDTARLEDFEGRSPHNQFHIRSYQNLARNIELNTALYYTDKLPADAVQDYFRLDAGLAWQISRSWELSLAGQNLLDRYHQEFVSSSGVTATEVQRSVYIKIRYEFH